MIVKGKAENSGIFIWFLLIILVLSIALLLKFYKSNSPVSFTGESYFWDFETIKNDCFADEDYLLSTANGQNDEIALSGRYSCKLDKENRYSPTFVMQNPIPGKSYMVSVWTKKIHPVDINLYVCSTNFEEFNLSTNEIVRRNSDFWELMRLQFKVPEKNTPKALKFYLYKDESDNPIYLDDFKIVELEPNNTGLAENHVFMPKIFNLTIDKEGKTYLEKMRGRSIAQGTIFNDGSKAKGKIDYNGAEIKVQYRLKGDWLDHISGNPSLRVDINSDSSWEGMQSLSIQEPHTRGFLREWVFFKFLDYADVLHPRYDFIWYQKNSDKPIVFSYEEHFTKNLVENSERREGPIVKLTEDRIWDITKRYFKQRNGSYPTIDKKDESYWLSEIRSFKEGKLTKNLTLMKNFELAHTLMNQFKYNLKPVDEIFDLHRLAKYMALVDITMAHHATTWHNQRFYYNPVTSLLEPIGFDAFTSGDPMHVGGSIMSKYFYKKRDVPYEPLEQLFYDSTYVDIYFKYLNKYSKPSFITNILNDIEEDILERERFLQLRYKDYNYDRREILKKAKSIRIALPGFSNSLRAYRQKNVKGKSQVKLFNAHDFPLYVYSDKNRSNKKIIYPQNKNYQVEYFDYHVPESIKHLYFEVVGIDSLIKVEILPWSIPQESTPRQELIVSDLNEFSEMLEVRNQDVLFKKGKHNINEPLVIGKNKNLKIFSNTEITFTNGAFLLSYSPVFVIGDKNAPVKIKCDDGKAGSFTVIQAGGKSVLKHVEFSNQNTLIVDNWNLTGGVSFYESDVDVTHVAFRNNNCEDALNIIRSEFKMDKCLFYGTYGDAFDADFCKGSIIDCQYLKSGNDAIDVSGTNISVFRTTIDEAGDKGISAGENSQVKVYDSKILNANIGAASKDLSTLELNNVDISFCKTGVTAFQKKPEFGPATIINNNLVISETERQKMIEESSQFIIK